MAARQYRIGVSAMSRSSRPTRCCGTCSELLSATEPDSAASIPAHIPTSSAAQLDRGSGHQCPHAWARRAEPGVGSKKAAPFGPGRRRRGARGCRTHRKAARGRGDLSGVDRAAARRSGRCSHRPGHLGLVQSPPGARRHSCWRARHHAERTGGSPPARRRQQRRLDRPLPGDQHDDVPRSRQAPTTEARLPERHRGGGNGVPLGSAPRAQPPHALAPKI